MDRSARGVLITEYEHLIPTINLPDLDDRLLVAAAIKAEASSIVTFNLSDFPSSSLSCYGIEAIHLDRFILFLIDRYPKNMFNNCRDTSKNVKKPS